MSDLLGPCSRWKNKGDYFEAHLIAQSANNLLLSCCCSTLVFPTWHGAFSPPSSSCAHLNSKSNTLKTVVPKSLQIFLSSISVLIFLLMIKAVGFSFFFFSPPQIWYEVILCCKQLDVSQCLQGKDLGGSSNSLMTLKCFSCVWGGEHCRKYTVGGFIVPLGAGGPRSFNERMRKMLTAWIPR